MVKYKKFMLEDFPRSSVVNSGVYPENVDIDNFINDVVSKHLNSIIEPGEASSAPLQENKLTASSEKMIDELSENYNIDADNLFVDDHLIDVEAIKKEAYEKGVADATSNYQPLLDEASVNTGLASLLHEKLVSVVPRRDLDTQIAKVSAQSVSAIARKLHLILPANFEEIIVEGLITKLKKFYKEGQIIVTVHPNKYDFCKEILQSELIPDKFKDSFYIIKDSKIGLDDCSLEWQDTRLEYNQEQLSEEIDKIIEQLKTAS